MNIVGNTLRMAEILEKKNFTKEEAREFLELLREETPSKNDLNFIKQELESKIEKESSSLKEEIKGEISSLKEEIREVKTDLAWIKVLGGGLIVGVLAQIFISLFS